MRATLSVCLCLMCLTSLMCLSCASTFVSNKHSEVFVHNFVMNTTCHLSTAEMWNKMLNTTYLQLAAREWSATHDISEWQSTPFAHTHTTEPEIWNYVQQYNIPPTALKTHVQYISAVHLPGVLSVFMDVNSKLAINKYVYVTRDDRPTMHTVTVISGIPLISDCVIYSRNTAAKRNAMLSRNTATFPVIPWYLKLFQSHIEQSLRDSLWRNTWALTRAWCGELDA